eukprot:6941182-Pyramimonas_sp.AAC.1
MNVSKVVLADGSCISAGDILRTGEKRYFILGGAEEGGNMAFIVQELHFICQVLPSASRRRKGGAP